MRLFGRRERPPAEATGRLDRDERVVSWATAADGGAVLATPLGLWLPGRPSGSAVAPGRQGDLAGGRAHGRRGPVTPATACWTELPPRSVRIAVPRDLPQTVRVRVERTIASTRHYPLAAGGGVRVVGRRVPGQDGVGWQLVFDQGVDRDDPAVRGCLGRDGAAVPLPARPVAPAPGDPPADDRGGRTSAYQLRTAIVGIAARRDPAAART